MDILLKPVITEKANKNSELRNSYTFLVRATANKIEIKKAAQKKYGVSVERVNIINYAPQRFRKYTKRGTQNAKIASYKKAIVQVKEGETIDFYSNL